MVKIQITREQAEAFKKFKIYEISLETFIKHRNDLNRDFSCLNYLSVDEMARALYRGHEVKPEFKVGDWVVYSNGETHGDKVKQIADIDNAHAHFGKDRSMLIQTLRHATHEEKERGWWAKHGRDVWELKKGDVIHALKYGTMGDIKVPAIITENRDKENFRVICFVEDRKD